jgi:hypothetical protein
VFEGSVSAEGHVPSTIACMSTVACSCELCEVGSLCLECALFSLTHSPWA